MNRRELLAAFLGLPAVAALGCRAAPELMTLDGIEGELVGESEDVGHRIRDGWSIKTAIENWIELDAVIIGGGIAGLAAARGLLAAGCTRFAVLELEHAAGGTSKGGKSSVTAYPWGAHYVPAPTSDNPQLVRLFDEMGLLEGRDETGEPVVAEQFLCRDPEERVFYKGIWFEGLYLRAGASDDDLAQLARFETEMDAWAARRDGAGRRGFSLPISAGSDDPEFTSLDKQSFADWLDKRGFTSPRLRWLADYSCRDDYGLRLEQASAWAGVFYFASRISRPGAPPQPLVSWPEGNARLVEHLQRGCRQQLQTGVAAVELRPQSEDGDATSWEVLAIERRTGQPVGYRARRAIFAAPQFIADRVVAPFRNAASPRSDGFEYGSWVVANIHLRERPSSRGFDPAWDNVLYESPSLGYVSATHQQSRHRGPTVWTWYYPFCDDDPTAARKRLLETTWSDWAEIVLADLGRPHRNLHECVERIDVMRWGHAMIRPKPGFMWGEKRRQAAQPYRGLHFAHTDLSGVALFEEAFDRGLRAAEAVASELKTLQALPGQAHDAS